MRRERHTRKEVENERQKKSIEEKKITVARTTQQVELIKTRNLFSVSFCAFFLIVECETKESENFFINKFFFTFC